MYVGFSFNSGSTYKPNGEPSLIDLVVLTHPTLVFSSWDRHIVLFSFSFHMNRHRRSWWKLDVSFNLHMNQHWRRQWKLNPQFRTRLRYGTGIRLPPNGMRAHPTSWLLVGGMGPTVTVSKYITRFGVVFRQFQRVLFLCGTGTHMLVPLLVLPFSLVIWKFSSVGTTGYNWNRPPISEFLS
jgi:hypothetical protein